MQAGFKVAALVCTGLLVTACQNYSTGNPTTDRAVVGAAGGAVLGQALGGDTESTLGGAALGGLAGGLTAPGQPLAPRY